MDADVDDATKEIIEEKLGKAVLTKEMILKEPEKYIGMKVEYTGYDTTLVNQTIDWRIYGLDAQGNIMLKANNYINLSYKTNDYPIGISQGSGISRIKSTIDPSTLIGYISTSSNWNEYAIYGKTVARGAMTLPEFIDGYNLVNEEDFMVEYIAKGDTSSDNSITAKLDGYAIKKGTGNYSYAGSNLTEKTSTGMNFYIIDTDKAIHMWLASNNVDTGSSVWRVYSGGHLYGANYDDGRGGLCPVVSLTCGILSENENGNIEVK